MMQNRKWLLLLLGLALLLCGSLALAEGDHPAPKFAIEGVSSGTVTREVSQFFTVDIEAPGMTAARLKTVHNGDTENPAYEYYNWYGDWERYWGPAQHVIADRTRIDEVPAQSKNTFTTTAQVCYDVLGDTNWEDLNWVDVEGSVDVIITTKGTLKTPTVTASASIRRGDLLEVTVNNASNVLGKENCEILASIGHYDDEAVTYSGSWLYNGWTGGNKVLLDTSMLEPGQYQLDVTYGCRGYSRVNCITEITVEAAPDDEVILSVSKTDMEAFEDYFYTICAPRAKRVQLLEVNRKVWQDMDGGDSTRSNSLPLDMGEYDLFARAYYGNGVTRDSEIIHVSVSGVGTLVPATVSDMPDCISYGEDLTFTINPVAHAMSYDVRLRDPQHDDEEICAWWQVSAGEFTIPGSFFEADHAYSIDVVATAQGYNAGWMEPWQHFLVADNLDKKIGITVEPKEDIWSNDTQVTVTVTAPGASVIQLHHRDMNYLEVHKDEAVFDEINFNQDGDMMLWARVSYNEEYKGYGRQKIRQLIRDDEIEWDAVSAPVTVTVHSNGYTVCPDFKLSSHTVSRGEWLSVDIHEGGNAETMHLRILDNDGEERYFREAYGPGEYELPTSLEPGNYWVTMDSVRTGYMWSHGTDQPFIVTESASEAYFVASPTDVEFNEPFYLMAYYPGAEKIQIRYRNDENRVWGTWDGEYAYNDSEWRWAMDEGYEDGQWIGNTQPLYAYALVKGKWKLIGRVDMNVAEPEHLPDPQITVNGSQDTLIYGEEGTLDIAISLYDGEYPDAHCHVELYVDNDDCIYEENKNLDELELTIEDDSIRFGRTYRLECWLDPNEYVSGYLGSYTCLTFVLADESAVLHEDIEVTVSDTEPLVNTNIDVYVSAPGAHAIVVWKNGDPDWFEDCDFVTNSRDIHSTDVTLIYAQACYDDINWDDVNWDEFDWNALNWSQPSVPVEINPRSEGETDVPPMDVPESVAWGDWLEFTISDEIPDVEQFDVRIGSDDDEEIEFRRFWAPGTYRLPTNALEVGREYWLKLDCKQPGYEWNDSERYTFTVTEGSHSQPYFTVDRTELAVDEVFIPAIYAPGAEEVRIIADGNPEDVWGCWDGEYGTTDANWEWRWDWGYWNDDANEGIHTMTGQYRMPNKKTWTNIKPTVTFHLSLKGKLAGPEITVPSTVKFDEAFNITIGHVENARHYNVSIHKPNEDSKINLYRNQISGDVVFTIPAYRLEPNETYWIDVGVNADGYDYSYADRSILVKGEEDGHLIELSAFYRDGLDNILIEDDFRVTASAKGAYAMAIYYGDQRHYFVGNEVDETFREGQATQEVLYARASYDASLKGKREEDVNWEKVEWSAPSDTIDLRFIALGRCGEPDYDVPAMILSGDTLIIKSIQLGEHANEAHANISTVDLSRDARWINDDWWGWDEEDRTIEISTEGLEPGIYYLAVHNSVDVGNNGEPGFHTSGNWRSFEILSGDNVLKLPLALVTIEEEAFEGINVQIVEIPNGIKTIGTRAFADCGRLVEVIIPSSVTSISSSAFDGCDFSSLVFVTSSKTAKQYAEKLGIRVK